MMPKIVVAYGVFNCVNCVVGADLRIYSQTMKIEERARSRAQEESLILPSSDQAICAWPWHALGDDADM